MTMKEHNHNNSKMQNLSFPDIYDPNSTYYMIQKLWDDLNLYELLDNANITSDKIFRFMDGPPFVSSSNLHFGHIHVSSCKSLVLNYKRMTGHQVLNKLGFDCHGLPIEVAANQKLNIKTKKDFEKLGLKSYNDECKSLIKKFSNSWENIFRRIGRFVDYQDNYMTLEPEFMESVWWCFKYLWDSGLVYKAYKIMAYSTGAHTPLSNSEASEEYITRTDPSVYVKFQDKANSNLYYIAWTTTPWTLPSNLALCVNPRFEYVIIHDKKTDELWTVLKGTEDKLYQQNKKIKTLPYETIYTKLGSELVNTEYVPVFNYFAERLYKIIGGSYVTADTGTGIVHVAPAFGEDDYDISISQGIVTKENIAEYGPVDDEGKFTDAIIDFAGIYVFDANDKIIDMLARQKKIIRKEMYEHSYPYCGRTHTPLIYKLVSSYFIEVTKIKNKLLENNAKINWVPEHIGQHRFYQWLANIKDWGVSRARYFGTPLPIWVAEDGDSICIGSVDELTNLSGIRIMDLHLENIINIEIIRNDKKYKNCGLVFDCWFESGCVPFGQIHYPFNEYSRELLDSTNFECLSDFICEGVDQTRGWFYSLLVLSTAILNKPPVKNIICTGLILAEDGKKFAKRLNNFIPPEQILIKYGPDAVRLYLTQSPAAHADSFKFAENDLTNIVRKFIQWINCCKFFSEHYIKFNKDGNIFDNMAYKKTNNLTDKWIISCVNSFVNLFRTSINSYEISKIGDELINTIENITNWYIKLNRNRIRGRDYDLIEQITALSTLWHVIHIFNIAMAPLLPFITELVYQETKKLSNNAKISVHLESYPEILNVDKDIERKMSRLQHVASLVRTLRSSPKSAQVGASSTRLPIKSITIGCHDDEYVNDILAVSKYLMNETNILDIYYVDMSKVTNYKITLDSKKIGMKYKKDAHNIHKLVNNLSQSDISNAINLKKLIIPNNINNKSYEIDQDEFIITLVLKTHEERKQLELEHVDILDNGVYVSIDLTQNDKIVELYAVKLFIVTVQDLRKKTQLKPWNKIKIFYDAQNELRMNIIKNHGYLMRILNNNEIFNYKYLKNPLIATQVKVFDSLLIIAIEQVDDIQDQSITPEGNMRNANHPSIQNLDPPPNEL